MTKNVCEPQNILRLQLAIFQKSIEGVLGHMPPPPLPPLAPMSLLQLYVHQLAQESVEEKLERTVTQSANSLK